MSSEIEVKATNTGIVKSKWDEQLASAAQAAAESEDAGGAFISFQAGQITVSGEAVADNKLKVVVLDSIYENVFYEGRYNPKNKVPPACYAYGREKENMRPHPDAPKPQCETCAACPKNVFGSAEETEGKACKNVRRLALIAGNIPAEDVSATEIRYMKTPVTSTKAWAVYVKTLNAMFSRPPYGVVTEISTIPDKKHQFHVTFKPVGLLTDEWLEPVMGKMKVAEASIEFPYAQPNPEVAPDTDGKPTKY